MVQCTAFGGTWQRGIGWSTDSPGCAAAGLEAEENAAMLVGIEECACCVESGDDDYSLDTDTGVCNREPSSPSLLSKPSNKTGRATGCFSRPIYLPPNDTFLLLRNLAGPAPPPPPVTTKELKEDTTEIHTGMFILIVICCCGAGLVAAGSIFLKVQERQVCPQSQTHSSHECGGE